MLTGLNHITLSVRDLEESINFYTRLGFVAKVKWDTGAYLSLSELWLCLALGNVDRSRDYSHIALSVEKAYFLDMSNLVSKLRLIQWQENSSEGDSVYILDPNGHKLEIHAGDLESRLLSLKEKPYKGLVWL